MVLLLPPAAVILDTTRCWISLYLSLSLWMNLHFIAPPFSSLPPSLTHSLPGVASRRPTGQQWLRVTRQLAQQAAVRAQQGPQAGQGQGW
jgi:hypothetical protein